MSAIIFFAPSLSSADTTSDDSEDDSEEEAEPYDLSKFPQWAKDLRRFEIVSLGSVPFVMFTVTTVFSSYLYFSGENEQFINPFVRSAYSEKQQMQIFFLSIGTGVFIGLTDLTINIIKRTSERKKAMRIKAAEDQIIVIPFKDDQDRHHPDGSPPPNETGEGAPSHDTFNRGVPPTDRPPPQEESASGSLPEIPQSTTR